MSNVERREFLTGLALATAGAVLFSAKAIVVKLSYRHGVDATTLIALRMLFALPLFIAALIWSSRGAKPLTRQDHLRIIVIGLLGYYGASYLDFLGLQYITAALERLILYVYPTLVLLLSALLFGHRITRQDTLAMLLAYAGIVLVFWHDVRFDADGVALGATLVFASTVLYAIYLVASGALVQRIGTIRLTSYAMCAAGVGVLAQFAVLKPLSAFVQPAPVLWLSLFNAVMCTVVPVFAMMMAVARMGAGPASLAGMVGPVATIALGYLFLDEPVTSWQLAGTTLVIAGVFVLSRRTIASIRTTPGGTT